MKRRTVGLTLASAVLAMGAALLANNWAANRGNADPAGDHQGVVVAAMTIPYGQVIEAQHVRLLQMDKATIPEGTFSDTTEVIGQVAKISLLSGDVLRTERFSDTQGSTLAVLINKNMRAVTVRVDDVIGVAGFLLPGNTVDVLATRQNGSNRTVESRTLLRNLKVLAVDQTAATDNSKPVIVRAVTLEMTPKQAETLVKARDEGKIQLTLRNPFDDSMPDEPAAPAPKKVAVARAPAPFVTTIIRGTEVSSVRR